jgi:hypothetical protein
VSEHRGERKRARSASEPRDSTIGALIPLFGVGEDYGILSVVSDP